MSYQLIYKLAQENRVNEIMLLCKENIKEELFQAFDAGLISLPEILHTEPHPISSGLEYRFEQNRKAMTWGEYSERRDADATDKKDESEHALTINLVKEPEQEPKPPKIYTLEEKPLDVDLDPLKKDVDIDAKEPKQLDMIEYINSVPDKKDDGPVIQLPEKMPEAVSSAPVKKHKPYKGERVAIDIKKFLLAVRIKSGQTTKRAQAIYLGFQSAHYLDLFNQVAGVTKTKYGQYLIDVLGPEIKA